MTVYTPLQLATYATLGLAETLPSDVLTCIANVRLEAVDLHDLEESVWPNTATFCTLRSAARLSSPRDGPSGVSGTNPS